MAKTLAERTRAALEPSARLKDVRSVLADNEAAFEQLKRDVGAAETAELDLALAPDEARAAHGRRTELQFDAARAEAAIQQLRDRVEELQSNEAETVRREAYATAKAANEALAEDLRTKGAAVLAELADLAGRIAANDALIARVNLELPRRAEKLISAEVTARGAMNENFWPSRDNLIRITDMRLPIFGRPGLSWPRPIDFSKIFEVQRAPRASVLADEE